MKKCIMLLSGILAGAVMISSCNKDQDETWKTIPQGVITVDSGDAVFSVNGVEAPAGSIKVAPKSASSADVTLSGVVPGYSELVVRTSLSKSDEEGVYDFSGSTGLTEGPSINLKGAEPAEVYVISIEGTISMEGKATGRITTALTELGKGDIAGLWNVNRVAPAVDEMPTTGPVWVKWTVNDTEKYASAPQMGILAAALLGLTYADHLDQINLCESGNVTITYWDGESETPDAELDESGENYIFSTTHDEWYKTEEDNQVFWFARNGYFYLIPNADNLDIEDEEVDFSRETIYSTIKNLAVVKVDTEALTAVVDQVLKEGIAFKYEQSGDALKLYIDKSQIDPVVNAFIPALPYLDILLENYESSEDKSEQQTAQSIRIVLSMLGLEKPSDFEGLWNATTEFQIELNFVRAVL